MAKRSFIFYGWYIVAAGLLIEALAYGSRYSFSVIFPSLLKEFDWPRDTTALMFSLNLFFYGPAAPVAGAMVDRFGPRKTMGFGLIILILGLVLSRFASAPWHFYLSFGLLGGVGLCLIGTVPLITVIRNWFEKYRGTAISLTYVGAGGPYIMYPFIAFLIATLGWRNTFLVEAAILAILFVPVIAFVIRYHPREKGLSRDGIVETMDGNQVKMVYGIVDRAWTDIDWTLSKAIRTRRLWMICLVTFCIWGLVQQTLVAHHVAFAEDMGYSEMYASSVLSLFGIAVAFGCLFSLISDRIGREMTTVIATVIGISGIAVLMLIRDASQPWMLYYYAVATGFGLGITFPLVGAVVTDVFQGPKVGAIIGSVWCSFSLGATIGPWLAGWIFEATGSYMPAFSMSMGMFVLGCLAMWVAAPRRVRLVPGRARARQGAGKPTETSQA